MTKAEVERYLEGATWRLKVQAQFDYSLANLIGLAYARTQSNSVNFPTLEEAYASLFAEELQKKEDEVKANEIRINNSRNRFMEFALRHNAKLKKGVEIKLNDN